jgi:hypothetical protein
MVRKAKFLQGGRGSVSRATYFSGEHGDWLLFAIWLRHFSLAIEEGAISHGLIQTLREKHINIVDYEPKGDKTERPALVHQVLTTVARRSG